MGRKLAPKSKRKGGSLQKQRQQATATASANAAMTEHWNFLAEAGPGCHIARHPEDDNEDVDVSGSPNSNRSSSNDWVLEWESVEADEFGDDEVPDLAVDPEEHTLTLCNVDAVYKVAYISVFDCVLTGRDGKVLTAGTTTTTGASLKNSSNGTVSRSSDKLKSCTTLIVLCPPYTFCHLCHLPETVSPASLDLESDVQEWRRHADPADTHSQTIGFPLATSTTASFLCTQGVGGCLTHFFDGNLHAIDFRCAIGTPLLAVGSGTVVSVKLDNGHVTGIAVNNLFSWNSILLQLDEHGNDKSDDPKSTANHPALDVIDGLDDEEEVRMKSGPLFVEYVHIESATVTVGDRVEAGQVIGTSGSVGFSPEPHLHLACYRSADDAAPTCRVFFHAAKSTTTNDSNNTDTSRGQGKLFLPKAGQWYNEDGRVATR